jgi:hypothetical protein
MAIPQNKKELMDFSKENFSRLMEFVNILSGTSNQKNKIRDVLCYIYEWHLMVEKWHTAGMAGGSPKMPAEGYTFRDLDRLNRDIHKKYQKTQLDEAINSLQNSHKMVMAIINKHTNTELFAKKKYSWAGTTSLSFYLIRTTSSMYNWGVKTLKSKR